MYLPQWDLYCHEKINGRHSTLQRESGQTRAPIYLGAAAVLPAGRLISLPHQNWAPGLGCNKVMPTYPPTGGKGKASIIVWVLTEHLHRKWWNNRDYILEN